MDSNSTNHSAAAFVFGAGKLKISQSQFLYNRAASAVGGIAIRDVISTEVADSIFDGNYAGGNETSRIGGGALTLLIYDLPLNDSAFLLIINSTFNNCSEQNGGVIFLDSYAPIHLKINTSRFTKNHSGKDGGAVWLSLTEDTQKGPAKCNERYWPSWDYKSHVIFEDTTFQENIASEVGGAVYITNFRVPFFGQFCVSR